MNNNLKYYLTGKGLVGGKGNAIGYEKNKGLKEYQDFMRTAKQNGYSTTEAKEMYKNQKNKNKNLWDEYKKNARQLKKLPRYNPNDYMPVEIDENLKSMSLPILKRYAKKNNIKLSKIDAKTGKRKPLNKKELLVRISKQFKLRGINEENEKIDAEQLQNVIRDTNNNNNLDYEEQIRLSNIDTQKEVAKEREKMEMILDLYRKAGI